MIGVFIIISLQKNCLSKSLESYINAVFGTFYLNYAQHDTYEDTCHQIEIQDLIVHLIRRADLVPVWQNRRNKDNSFGEFLFLFSVKVCRPFLGVMVRFNQRKFLQQPRLKEDKKKAFYQSTYIN